MNAENLRILQKRIPEGVDALLITSELHQFYLTGFNYTDGWLAVTREKAFVFTDFRFIEAAREKIDAHAFQVFENTSSAFVRDTLKAENVASMMFEDASVTVARYHRMQKEFEGIELLPMESLVEAQREFKTEAELCVIKQAQEITDAAFDHILGYITPERTELDVAQELEAFMRSKGASGTSFSTISISGAKTAVPHGEPEDRKLIPGFLTMDFGCVYHGYCSDMTRTVVVGGIDDEMKRVYDTVLAAQEAVLEAIDWHKNCGDMDKIARDLIDNAGYKGAFGHSLGHGVGLFIHEMPKLSMNCKTTLENGHVVTVEPGIYLPGKYGVRIEDMVIIHNNRAEDITHSPKQLIVL